MKTTFRVALVVLAAASLLVLAFTAQANKPGCHQVSGKLSNGDPGQMIGTLSGTYYLDWDNLWFAEPYPMYPGATPVFTMGVPTWVETQRGDIRFDEYSLLDQDEQAGQNGVVLSIITGGTDDWEGASGLITLTGYFHASTGQGEWTYRGEICRP
jgi:hypothetical protein